MDEWLGYTLDASDRIVDVDGRWDEFALRNDAPHLTRDHVLSRPLLSFVTGRDMQELLRLVLEGVRSGRRVALEFRCDAPAERRHLLFEAVALPGRGVRCTTTLRHAEPRPPQALIAPGAPRREDVLVVCSWCLRLRVGAEWLIVEDTAARLGLFEDQAVPRLSHGICTDCAMRLRAAVGAG